MPVHQGPGYIRVVGRHLLLDVSHKVDKTKLFYTNGKASRALAMTRLPASYLRQMSPLRVGTNVGRRGFGPSDMGPCGLMIKRRPPFFAL